MGILITILNELTYRFIRFRQAIHKDKPLAVSICAISGCLALLLFFLHKAGRRRQSAACTRCPCR